LLLLLLLRTLTGLLRLTRSAAPAAAPALARGLGLARRSLSLSLLRLLLLLRRPLLLRLPLRTLRTRPALPLLPLGPPAALLRLWSPSLTVARTLPLALRLLLRPLVLPGRLFPGALLELAHLFLHVSRRLPVLLQAHLVVPAVRAALPSLGIGLLTGGAQDTFRERHR
jgi:hypothetical protein